MTIVWPVLRFMASLRNLLNIDYPNVVKNILSCTCNWIIDNLVTITALIVPFLICSACVTHNTRRENLKMEFWSDWELGSWKDSYDHCMACPSIYGFWFFHWYLLYIKVNSKIKSAKCSNFCSIFARQFIVITPVLIN
jgi:hypothetical protein